MVGAPLGTLLVRGQFMIYEDRLALLKRARAESGLPLDFWEELTDGLDYKSLAILCGRSALFPKYMNSSVKP